MTPHLTALEPSYNILLVNKCVRWKLQIERKSKKNKKLIIGQSRRGSGGQDSPHISHMCIKAPPPPLLSVPKIDGSRLAVPARHPVPHMLAAMFSHPALLEADTEMRHLNTYCPHTLDLCCAGCTSSLFQECVIYVTPIKNILLHRIHLNECDLAAPLPPSLVKCQWMQIDFRVDSSSYRQALGLQV